MTFYKARFMQVTRDEYVAAIICTAVFKYHSYYDGVHYNYLTNLNLVAYNK